MMQIYLSKLLSHRMSAHLSPQRSIDRRALQWYAHQVTVAGTECVIVMEQQSRYALVFCALKNADLEDFPSLFRERLWREMAVITQLEAQLKEEDLAFLIELAASIAQQQSYQSGGNRSVMSHILQVKEHLEHLVCSQQLALPVNHDDSVRYDLLVNAQRRKRKEDQDYFVPLDVFSSFWLGLLDHVSEVKPELALSRRQKRYLAPNVIQVDFSRGRA